MHKYLSALALIGATGFAATQPLLVRTVSNASLGPANVPFSCEVFETEVVITRTYGKLTTTERRNITLKGETRGHIQKALDGEVKVEKSKFPVLGAPTISEYAVHVDPKDKKEGQLVLLYSSNAGGKKQNTSGEASILRRILADLCTSSR